MPRGRRLKDVETYKRLMTRHKLIGLCKSQPLDRCVDCATILTQEPSFLISWGQLNSLITLLVKYETSSGLSKDDKRYLRSHLATFVTAWKYMTEVHPQKGIINAAMAQKPERTDDEGPDDSTDSRIITP